MNDVPSAKEFAKEVEAGIRSSGKFRHGFQMKLPVMNHTKNQ